MRIKADVSGILAVVQRGGLLFQFFLQAKRKLLLTVWHSSNWQLQSGHARRLETVQLFWQQCIEAYIVDSVPCKKNKFNLRAFATNRTHFMHSAFKKEILSKYSGSPVIFTVACDN